MLFYFIMYFNKINSTIVLSIAIFIVYLNLPAPTVLVKDKNKIQICNSCIHY